MGDGCIVFLAIDFTQFVCDVSICDDDDVDTSDDMLDDLRSSAAEWVGLALHILF